MKACWALWRVHKRLKRGTRSVSGARSPATPCLRSLSEVGLDAGCKCHPGGVDTTQVAYLVVISLALDRDGSIQEVFNPAAGIYTWLGFRVPQGFASSHVLREVHAEARPNERMPLAALPVVVHVQPNRYLPHFIDRAPFQRWLGPA